MAFHFPHWSFIKRIFFLLLLTFNTIVSSAESTIPSLLKSLQAMPHDVHYVDSLNELAFLYSRVDLKEMEKCGQQACQLAKEFNYPRGLADGKIRLGIYHQNVGNFSKAITLFEEALGIRQQLNDEDLIASAFSNIGYCHYSQKNVDSAILNYQAGFAVLSSQPISKIKGKLYNNLSEVYSLSEDYKTALIYLDSSFQVWEEIKIPSEKAITLINKANLYWLLENGKAAENSYRESLIFFEESGDQRGKSAAYLGLGNLFLEQLDYTAADEFYQKALQLKTAIGKYDLIPILHNTGTIKRKKGDVQNAISFFNRSIATATTIQDTWGLAHGNYELGNIFNDQGNYSKAKEYYLKAIPFFEEDSDLYTKSLIAFDLIEVFQKLGETDQAIAFSKEYNALQDSIYFNKLDAANYQANWEASEKKISNLKLEISENKRKTLWTQGLTLVFFILGLLIFFIFYAYRNKQMQVQAYQKVDNLLREQELEIAYAQIEARDSAQQQIGQDLHDRLGLMLSTIKLYFNDFSEQLSELKTDTSIKQHKTIELLDDAVQEVRRISHDMQSGVLKKFGLSSAIRTLAETIKNSGQLKVEVNEHGLQERLDNATEFKIYKIIQELVGNVLKHAKANNLTIYLNRQDKLFNLIIEDNGIGFQPEKVADKTGMGLKNITYRVSELNGSCHFDSAEGRGTSVIIDIPLEN